MQPQGHSLVQPGLCKYLVLIAITKHSFNED